MEEAMASRNHYGWANYETWAVNLRLESDEFSRWWWWQRAAVLVRTGDDQAACKLAAMLKESLAEDAADSACTVFADLIHAALGEVDWDEIAQEMLDSARREWTSEGIRAMVAPCRARAPRTDRMHTRTRRRSGG